VHEELCTSFCTRALRVADLGLEAQNECRSLRVGIASQWSLSCTPGFDSDRSSQKASQNSYESRFSPQRAKGKARRGISPRRLYFSPIRPSIHHHHPQVLHRLVDAGFHPDTPKKSVSSALPDRESFVHASCTGLQVDTTALAFASSRHPLRDRRSFHVCWTDALVELEDLQDIQVWNTSVEGSRRILALQVNRCELEPSAELLSVVSLNISLDILLSTVHIRYRTGTSFVLRHPVISPANHTLFVPLSSLHRSTDLDSLSKAHETYFYSSLISFPAGRLSEDQDDEVKHNEEDGDGRHDSAGFHARSRGRGKCSRLQRNDGSLQS
jgi:hypothetical protein